MLPTPTNPTVGSGAIPAPPPIIVKPSPLPQCRPPVTEQTLLEHIGHSIIMYVQMLSVNAHGFLGVIGYELRWLEATAQLDTVGVPLGVIVGDGELDGGLAGVEVDALDAQARLAGGAPDHASHIGGGGFGRHLLARASDGVREKWLYRGDDGRVWDGAREDVLLRETLAQPRGEVHPREREREPVVVPTHHQHRHLRGGQLEQPGHLLVLLEGDRAQQFHVRVRPHHQVLDRAYGPEVPAVLREGGGKSPAPGDPVDQPLGDELLERLPHRVAPDAVLPAQLGLRRHPTPFPELAALQRVPQLAVEALVRRRASPPFGPGSSSHATHNVTTRTQSPPPANGIAEPRRSRGVHARDGHIRLRHPLAPGPPSTALTGTGHRE